MVFCQLFLPRIADRYASTDGLDKVCRVRYDRAVYPQSERIRQRRGSHSCRPLDIVRSFSKLLDKKLGVQTIPRDQWRESLLLLGFTERGTNSLSAMTQPVVDYSIGPEFSEEVISLQTTSDEYFTAELCWLVSHVRWDSGTDFHLLQYRSKSITRWFVRGMNRQI